MKKIMIVLTVIVLILTLLVGCSQDSGMSDQKAGSDATSQTAEKPVNDNPIKPVRDETKYAVEYFNQHAYTSDFSYNGKQPSLSNYWVYKEDNELRKATLDNYMTVSDSVKITAGDGLTEVLKTDYLNYYKYNNLDEILYPDATAYLEGTTEDQQEIFRLKIKNTESKELPAKNCVVDCFTTGYQGEPCEYMGLHKGDDIDKVIDTLGSPNRALGFESSGSNTYDIHMIYIDAANKRTARVTLQLYYDGMDSENTKAVLDHIVVYNRIEENSAH